MTEPAVVKNMGPPWRRPSGEVIPHGGLFTPTPREWRRMLDRHQLERRFLLVSEVHRSGNGEVSTTPPTPTDSWPLKMTPEVYLERYPSGPNAELARSVIAGRAG